MILDDAIIELFDQGIYSPATIDQMLHQRGNAWIRKALAERSSQLIREYVREVARKRTVLVPPRAPISIHVTGEPVAPRSVADAVARPRDVYGELVWVIGQGYKPKLECTSVDLRSAAAYLRQKADENIAKAESYEAQADQMDAAGATTLADLGMDDEAAA